MNEPHAMPSPTIRPITPDDCPALLALWTATPGVGLGPGDTAEGVAAFLARNSGLSPAAFDASAAMVGCTLCGHDGRRGTIYHLAVRPDHRHRGVGRALVDFCLTRLAAQGIHRCNALVYATNEDGQAFWTRAGWHRRDELLLYQRGTSG